MKKYTKPAIEIVELESRQNMADVNPISATSTTGASGEIVTVYNLALVSANSYEPNN